MFSKCISPILFMLCLNILSTVSMAGGVIPLRLGSFHDGRVVDFVPSSSDVIRWKSYGPGLDANMNDYIAYGAASTDIETRRFRILYGDATPGQTQIFFSLKGDTPTDPACTDNNPETVCVLAETKCMTSTREGSAYKLCSAFRVVVLINNKVVPPADPKAFWIGVIRHEIGHVLGLWHDNTGPMANGSLPFTACQKALWDLFTINPAISTWSYPTNVPACNKADLRRTQGHVFIEDGLAID